MSNFGSDRLAEHKARWNALSLEDREKIQAAATAASQGCHHRYAIYERFVEGKTQSCFSKKMKEEAAARVSVAAGGTYIGAGSMNGAHSMYYYATNGNAYSTSGNVTIHTGQPSPPPRSNTSTTCGKKRSRESDDDSPAPAIVSPPVKIHKLSVNDASRIREYTALQHQLDTVTKSEETLMVKLDDAKAKLIDVEADKNRLEKSKETLMVKLDNAETENDCLKGNLSTSDQERRRLEHEVAHLQRIMLQGGSAVREYFESEVARMEKEKDEVIAELKKQRETEQKALWTAALLMVVFRNLNGHKWA